MVRTRRRVAGHTGDPAVRSANSVRYWPRWASAARSGALETRIIPTYGE